MLPPGEAREMQTSLAAADAEDHGRLMSVRIAAEIRRAVLEGAMQPGTRVGQEWLAGQFGASRIPVREALMQLQNEGLVVVEPNRGARIADFNSREALEVYRMREVLEPLAISESVPLLSDEDLGTLQAMVQRLECAETIEEYIPLDREFHLKTYSRAPMPQLLAMVERFWNSTQHFRRWFVKDSLARDGLPLSDPQHLLLLDALLSRDAQAAASLVHLHIRRTRLLVEQKVRGADHAEAPAPAPRRNTVRPIA